LTELVRSATALVARLGRWRSGKRACTHNRGNPGGSEARRFERQRGNDKPQWKEVWKEPHTADHRRVIDSGPRRRNFVGVRKSSPWQRRSIGDRRRAPIIGIMPVVLLALSPCHAPSAAPQKFNVCALPSSYRSCHDTCNDDADSTRRLRLAVVTSRWPGGVRCYVRGVARYVYLCIFDRITIVMESSLWN